MEFKDALSFSLGDASQTLRVKLSSVRRLGTADGTGSEMAEPSRQVLLKLVKIRPERHRRDRLQTRGSVP